MEVEKFPSTEYTDEAVCPHCGRTLRGTFELFSEGDPLDGAETIETCENCGKLYEIRRNSEITYSTSKIKVKANKNKKEPRTWN